MLPDGFRATTQDGRHPRPQLLRGAWTDLGGEWGFATDDDDAGVDAGWAGNPEPFTRTITVPFPPESEASGIGDTGFHPVVWYRRVVTRDDIAGSGAHEPGARTLLRFGAVDYRASVWVDGEFTGRHEGGQSGFAVDITAFVRDPGHEPVVVVRAEDDPHDVEQPRGKQDWLERPHSIWYHRTTGIWQPVWLETVPALHVVRLAWGSDLARAAARLEIELNERPRVPVTVEVDLELDGRVLARCSALVTGRRANLECVLADAANGQALEGLLWTPEQPRLVDARVRVLDEPRGRILDEVASYLGLRSTDVADGWFRLNDRPVFIRSVLEQGYWPQSHLAAPNAEALRAEVQLIKDLGFNAVRVHQKAEDPRFLHWADRLGLLVWGEFGAPYQYSATAAMRTVREWMDVVERDISHPSIVTWVPVNESWGVQHISSDPAQEHFVRGIAELTRALDPSRPVVSNDGWEHAGSDLLTLHDYRATGAALAADYGDAEALGRLLDGPGPAGRRVSLDPVPRPLAAVHITEFGGITLATAEAEGAWGYATVADAGELVARVGELVTALRTSPWVAGYCYTQLTDTLQEANGLVGADRTPKAPLHTLRAIFAAPHR